MVLSAMSQSKTQTSTQVDMTHDSQTPNPEEHPSQTSAKEPSTASPSRRDVLKAAWAVPAIVAAGAVPSLGDNQSPGRVKPRRKPPEPVGSGVRPRRMPPERE